MLKKVMFTLLFHQLMPKKPKIFYFTTVLVTGPLKKYHLMINSLLLTSVTKQDRLFYYSLLALQKSIDKLITGFVPIQGSITSLLITVNTENVRVTSLFVTFHA